MAQGDTLVNALIGGVVSVLLTFIPFSPLLGGIVSGYLEGGTRNDGLRVGAIAGLIAMVPLLLFGMLLFGFIGILATGIIPIEASLIGGFIIVIILAMITIYTVGLSALGGWLGNYLLTDTDVGSASGID